LPDSTLLSELIAVPATAHDVGWVKRALQLAVRLEFAIVPPYLWAMRSIESHAGPACDLFHEVQMEEMLNLGLVCNILNSLSEMPKLWPGAAPTFPCPLPGGFHPGMEPVTLESCKHVPARWRREVQRCRQRQDGYSRLKC
jgi:hypothetical protein